MFAPAFVLAKDVVTPFVSISSTQDDNLYRLDPAILSALAGSISDSDTIYQTMVGVDVDLSQSNQRLNIKFSASDNHFKKNPSLDYFGQSLKAKWDWQLGNNIDGQVAANHETSLSDFANTSNQQSSEKTSDTVLIKSMWRYHPDWQVGAILSEDSNYYDLAALKTSDRDNRKATLLLNYLANSGSRVGLKLSQDNGVFPNRVLNNFDSADNAYRKESLLLTANWLLSGKSRLNLEAGWINRLNKHNSSRDYEGGEAKGTFTWSPLGKLSVDLVLYRQVDSSDYGTSSFSENTGFSVSPRWSISDKLFISGQLSNETRDYIGLNGGSSAFKEVYDKASCNLLYQANQNLDISLGFVLDQRDSTQALRDYESNKITLGLNVKL